MSRGAGRAFAAVTGASLLLAAVLLWPRLGERDAEVRAVGTSAPTLPAPASTRLGPSSASGPGGAPSSAARVGDASAAELGGGAPVDPLGEPPEPVPAYVQVHPESPTACPVDMVLVEGVHCPFLAHRCEEPRGASPTERCERYGARLLCEGRPVRLRFCVDRYEYPNQRAVRPAIFVSYREAARACRIEGKRLCSEEEWAMACEGRGRWPYPSGLVRDARSCNLDRPDHRPEARSLADPRQRAIEVERIDAREPSGSRPACVSNWGVYDLGGNVQEWVANRRGTRRGAERVSAIAGGNWGPGLASCRTLDASRGESYQSPRVGFRCCADDRAGRPARRSLPRGARLPRSGRVLSAAELSAPVTRAAPPSAGRR